MNPNLLRLLAAALLLPLLPAISSCVHEFPAPAELTGVRLHVRHNIDWEDYDFNFTRAESEWQARYIYRVYPKGYTQVATAEFTEFRDDLSLSDFSTTLPLPPGDWDIYVWQDFVRSDGYGFYDAADFSAISYSSPYTGNTDRRDAFEAGLSLTVGSSIEADYTENAEIELSRPVAKYVFVATDFEKFYHKMQTRADNASDGQILPSWGQLDDSQRNEFLKGFEIVGLYPFFMPSVYDLFSGKVTDSSRNISYTGGIRPYDEKYAEIAFDYVFLDDQPGSVQVQIGLRWPDGSLSALCNTITVPLKRSQTTYVYGEFLTTDIGSGLDVDFSFSGDFNIKL